MNGQASPEAVALQDRGVAVQGGNLLAGSVML